MNRARVAFWALLYAALLLYAMTIVSPLGFAPRGLTLDQGVAVFGRISYVQLGSDQQADWMANLLVLVPLGFMVAVACTPVRGTAERVAGGIIALGLCVAYVLAVKFVQVFFPRTVDLNYVIAQTLGSGLGVAAGTFGRAPVERAWAHVRHREPASLTVLLVVASAALLAYMLLPFDLVLTRADLAARMAALPGLLLGMPGAGRSPVLRVAMLAAGMVGMVPLGMLLARVQHRAGLLVLAGQGLFVLLVVTAAASLVMSASPSLLNLPPRVGGVVLGAAAMRWLQMNDVERLRPLLERAALLLIPPYLLALVLVHGLAAPGWRGLDAALAVIDHRYFVPMWTHYIVTKAQAARSELTQVAMYLPVGLVVWARGGRGWRGAALAGAVALLLAAALEYARWMKPGQALDINNPPIASLAAALAVLTAPFLWDVLRGAYQPQGRTHASRVR